MPKQRASYACRCIGRASRVSRNQVAAVANGRIFIEDKLDHLAALKVEASAHTGTSFAKTSAETQKRGGSWCSR